MLVLLLTAPTLSAHSSEEFLDLIDKTKESVVFIMNTPIEGTVQTGPAKPFQKKDEDEPAIRKDDKRIGTGFLIEGGYIVTNWHVIENAKKIEIYFERNLKPYVVELVGSDKDTDIAVLKTGPDFPKNKPMLQWRTKTVRQGEEVFAIGHPLGFEYTLTKGIISHVDRRLTSAWQPTFQTDTVINKGNSGGPLLDMDGLVVGVNVMIVSHSRAFSGMALAITHNAAESAVETLIADGVIVRPLMGVLLSYDKETYQVRAQGLNEGGAAELAGVKVGDLYLEINGIAIKRINDVFDILAESRPLDVLTVKILRDGKEMLIDITLAELVVESD